jgi:hypothetical protein
LAADARAVSERTPPLAADRAIGLGDPDLPGAAGFIPPVRCPRPTSWLGASALTGGFAPGRPP